VKCKFIKAAANNRKTMAAGVNNGYFMLVSLFHLKDDWNIKMGI
jgi:hypothetical protein